MMPYEVSNPVKFYAGGDTTSQAIGKHIAEIARIYDILNDGVDSAKSVVVVLSPNTVLKDEQLGITPAPLEIKQGNGVQRWSELPDGIRLAQAIDNLTSDDGVAPLSARQGKLLKELIDAVSKTEVVDDLTTGGSGKALSAEQGKALKALIDALTTPVPGPPGPKGIEWRGAWDGAVAYRKDDAVSYRGGSYIALKPSTGEPPTNAEFWGVLSAKGDDGIGAGDMTKAVYDPDGDGKVDAAVVADTANAVAWDDVTGKPEKFTCDIVDALDSDRADAALSAAQGKRLAGRIDSLYGDIPTTFFKSQEGTKKFTIPGDANDKWFVQVFVIYKQQGTPENTQGCVSVYMSIPRGVGNGSEYTGGAGFLCRGGLAVEAAFLSRTLSLFSIEDIPDIDSVIYVGRKID